MKKTALILAALVTGSVVSAQESSYSLSIDFPYVSKYVFRGIALADESIQPSINYSQGDFYFTFWTSQPVVGDVDNELDFTAGYGFELNETTALDVGLTMYYYPELDLSGGGDEATYEAYVGISGEVAGLTPSIYAYYDFTLDTLTLQGSVGYSVPLEAAGMSMDFAATFGSVSPDGGGDYLYWGFGVSVPYQLNDNASVYAGVDFTSTDIDDPIDHVGADEVYFKIGASIGF